MKYIFDLDDFCESHNVIPKLKELKLLLPKLKVNLFTIPDQTPLSLIYEALINDWIQLIPHGVTHSDNYEFSELSGKETYEKISSISDWPYYIRGFKAPGWQISNEAIKTLRDLEFWIAVQYTDGRMNNHPDGPFQPEIPDSVRSYAMNELPEGYQSIHGHCQNVCGNGLEELWPELIKLPTEAEFLFIDDYVKNTKQG